MTNKTALIESYDPIKTVFWTWEGLTLLIVSRAVLLMTVGGLFDTSLPNKGNLVS